MAVTNWKQYPHEIVKIDLNFQKRLSQFLTAHRDFSRNFLNSECQLCEFPDSESETLFLYSQVPWDSVWQRPQEIAIGLSAKRNFIYYSPVQFHELSRIQFDQWKWVRSLSGGRLKVFSPLILSGEYQSRLIRELNAKVQTRFIRRILGKRRPILLTNSPFPRYLLDHFGWRAVGMDLIDDFCAFDWALPDSRIREGEFLYRADFAFAGTEYLREKYQSKFPNLEFLPSGVNYSDFAEPREEPAEIKNFPHPRMVYGGSLSDRLDGYLFLEAAKAVKEGSVIVAGPKHASFQAPALPKNVHFLGMLPHQKLPGIYQHCDVGLLPFSEQSAAARATHPIKILEYFAAGLPVITTPIPDVIKYYEGLVEIRSRGEWESAIQKMISAKSDSAKAETRRNIAKSRSWESLVNKIELTLAEYDS